MNYEVLLSYSILGKIKNKTWDDFKNIMEKEYNWESLSDIKSSLTKIYEDPFDTDVLKIKIESDVRKTMRSINIKTVSFIYQYRENTSGEKQLFPIVQNSI